MRIAQIAPLYEAVPPQLYGGTERVVAYLADALSDMGHEVTVFASAESRTKAHLVPCRDRALRLDPERSWDLPAHLAMLEEVRARAGRFDVLHFHTDCLHMPVFRDMASRTLTTLHGRLDVKDLPAFYQYFRHFPVVSISHAQRAPLPFLNWAGTVHHGLPRELYPFTPAPKGGYLAFLGRIAPEKGPERAIEIARQAGVPLKIAAKIDRADLAYYHEAIEPLLGDPLVEFIGEVNDAQKSEFLGNALALLVPIDWPEPFGLVMIEAMACGTPVIAFRRGSVPEVVNDGITGFIVDGIEQAAAAVSRAAALERKRVRAVFEARFSADTMARAYLSIYERLLAAAREHETRFQVTRAPRIQPGATEKSAGAMRPDA